VLSTVTNLAHGSRRSTSIYLLLKIANGGEILRASIDRSRSSDVPSPNLLEKSCQGLRESRP
jgi:hypothetical protein